jgi:voltage-gated potassium channel
VRSTWYRRLRVHTTVLYVLALLKEFRASLGVLLVMLVVGTVLFHATPAEFGGPERATLLNAVYAAWMAMLVNPVNPVPSTWYLTLLTGFYPVIGFVVIGEGVVRLALLMFSRRHGRKEWMRVMASTYRDHVVLCGVGHLGIRVLEELVSANVPVVVIEKNEDSTFTMAAKRTGTPVIVGDMKDDQTLTNAGIPRARVVIVATNDDMANLEVALDSRRLNPGIRVVMRLFEQSIAQKVKNAFLVDAAFSDAALAAPMVTAMSLGGKVMNTTLIANIPHVTLEVRLEAGSELSGRRVDDAEQGYCCKILARTPEGAPIQLPPGATNRLGAGDVLVVHTPSSQLGTLAAAARVCGVGE